MIGKIIAGSSFAGTVGYVMKELSRILDAEGVNPPEVKNIIEDFKDQTRLNPRLKNTVGHISFSFSPKEAPHMTDALMTQIAKEYMQKMGITDTDRPTVNFGGNIGELPLPPNSSPAELSEAQLQRKPGESPEEYLARITALLNTVAEAMAVAAMERERRLRERMTKPKQKL